MSVVMKLDSGYPAGGEVSIAAPSTEERELLGPYLPRLVIDWIETAPERRHQVIEGTVAFVDISGFTKLSEALAKHGRLGAEELTATIAHCFVHLLDVAYDNGGRLLKFGGDALLLLYTGPDHEARACRAAFDMRHKLRDVGRLMVLGHRVNLRMSVGIHSGRFDMFLVGGSHRELVVTGPASTVTVSMEAAATAGEILVSAQTALALNPSDLGPAKAGGPGVAAATGEAGCAAPATAWPPAWAWPRRARARASLTAWGPSARKARSASRKPRLASRRAAVTRRLREDSGPEPTVIWECSALSRGSRDLRPRGR